MARILSELTWASMEVRSRKSSALWPFWRVTVPETMLTLAPEFAAGLGAAGVVPYMVREALSSSSGGPAAPKGEPSGVLGPGPVGGGGEETWGRGGAGICGAVGVAPPARVRA